VMLLAADSPSQRADLHVLSGNVARRAVVLTVSQGLGGKLVSGWRARSRVELRGQVVGCVSVMVIALRSLIGQGRAWANWAQLR